VDIAGYKPFFQFDLIDHKNGCLGVFSVPFIDHKNGLTGLLSSLFYSTQKWWWWWIRALFFS
jgi:hypothetical protein